MFPLTRTELPRSAEDLARAIGESLRRAVDASGEIVAVRDKAFPELAEIGVTLDGAELNPDPPRPPKPLDDGRPAFEVDQMQLSGRNMSLNGAILNLAMSASGVSLNAAPDRDGNLVLLVRRATAGNIEISCAQRDIEALLKNIAGRESQKHGVTLDDVKLEVRSRGSRSLEVEARLKAKKMFLSASVKIGAAVEIDDNLVAKVSGLSCHGEGAMGTMACSVLSPFLEAANNREFPLMALPLGGVQLRDVQIAAGENIAISAKFGSA